MGVRDIFAQNLRRIRSEKEISQEGLADAAGIDRTYVSSIERRRYAASIDVLAKIAAALGVTPADLLTPARKSPRTSKGNNKLQS